MCYRCPCSKTFCKLEYDFFCLYMNILRLVLSNRISQFRRLNINPKLCNKYITKWVSVIFLLYVNMSLSVGILLTCGRTGFCTWPRATFLYAKVRIGIKYLYISFIWSCCPIKNRLLWGCYQLARFFWPQFNSQTAVLEVVTLYETFQENDNTVLKCKWRARACPAQ